MKEMNKSERNERKENSVSNQIILQLDYGSN